LLRQAPESKKKVLKEIVKKLYDLLDMRGKSNAEKEELKKMLDASTESAEIVVTGKAFSGIRIAIGESEDTLSADHVGFCFRIDPDSDEIKARPVADIAEGEEEGQDSEEPE
ncbi:MAG: FapA family protein, partial [Candidatus Latescibacterota bacterium]